VALGAGLDVLKKRIPLATAATQTSDLPTRRTVTFVDVCLSTSGEYLFQGVVIISNCKSNLSLKIEFHV